MCHGMKVCLGSKGSRIGPSGGSRRLDPPTGDARAAEPARPAAAPKAVDTAKILNYNPKMEYRRQGKTELMVSAVCLGGHSRSDDKTRAEIISRCIELGINYIDACTDGEVRRDAKALRGRRDKMYLALSDCGREVRNEEFRTAKKLREVLDNLLKASGQEYTDLWRITCLEPGGRHTFDTACEIVDALETAKKQGKARFGGFSSHDRRWIKFMIEYFPQIDVVCFPFTTMTKAAPKDSLFPAQYRNESTSHWRDNRSGTSCGFFASSEGEWSGGAKPIESPDEHAARFAWWREARFGC